MANNRLFLIHKPTGKSVFLGKRMAVGWYTNVSNIGAIDFLRAIDQFFVDTSDDTSTQDDFILGMEDNSMAPDVAEIRYVDHKPVLVKKS